LQLNINGQSRTATADPSTPLLWVLRDVLNLTGTKFGCGIAACGACTVHVDGQPVRSCVTPTSALANQPIKTIESWARQKSPMPCKPRGSPSRCRNAVTAKAAC
jgi:isoquinoline 1-oxidoreductase subunit alpha